MYKTTASNVNIEKNPNANINTGINNGTLSQINNYNYQTTISDTPEYIGLSKNIIDAICRKNEIIEICDKLFKNGMNRIVISGLGVIGKTTLAVNIARKLKSEEKINHIIFLCCQYKENFEKKIKECYNFI